MKRQQFSFEERVRQRGAVLFISMMLLLVMTVLGFSAMKNATLEAKIANNFNQRSVTFQAADSALKNMSIKEVAKEALVSTSKVSQDKTVTMPKSGLISTGRVRYLSSAPAMGTSLGLFTTYHFNFTGKGVIPNPEDNSKNISRILVSKGGYIFAPKSN